jgi:hypothetical protein
MNEKMGNAKYFENDIDMPNNCKKTKSETKNNTFCLLF